MDFTGTQLHINVLEMKTVKIALLAYYKQFQLKTIHFQIDNTTALYYLAKMGNQKQVFNRISKRNLEVSPTPWDHDNCRKSFKLHEPRGRLAVKKLKFVRSREDQK